MLHLIFQPIDQTLIDRITEGDDVVFLESAVLGLLRNSRWANQISLLENSVHLFVMSDALSVRGIGQTNLISGLVVLDQAGLVDLTVKNTAIHSWY